MVWEMEKIRKTVVSQLKKSHRAFSGSMAIKRRVILWESQAKRITRPDPKILKNQRGKRGKLIIGALTEVHA
jgi:hypothetical protein